MSKIPDWIGRGPRCSRSPTSATAALGAATAPHATAALVACAAPPCNCSPSKVTCAPSLPPAPPPHKATTTTQKSGMPDLPQLHLRRRAFRRRCAWYSPFLILGNSWLKNRGCRGSNHTKRTYEHPRGRGIFRFFRFRPTTPHSTRLPTAMPVVPSVFVSRHRRVTTFFLGSRNRLHPSIELTAGMRAITFLFVCDDFLVEKSRQRGSRGSLKDRTQALSDHDHVVWRRARRMPTDCIPWPA
eukprot:COSAG01_NODE_4268_length_5196_cov_4.984304_3_plen_242_part_00